MQLTIPQIIRLSQEQYGINVDSSQVLQASFAQDEYLRDVLSKHAVSAATIEAIAQKSQQVFDVRLMRAGKPYTIIKGKDEQVDYFIYEKNEADFVVISLRDSIHIYEDRKEVDRKEGFVAGTIEASLFEEIEAQGADIRIVSELEEVFAWTVDFYDLKKGDRFEILFEEEFVNGISLGNYYIIAAMLEQDGSEYRAYRFPVHGDSSQYYDSNGFPLRKAFLKSPLYYQAVEDRREEDNSNARMLPTKSSHKGVHYEASKGAEVYAVGDGEIIQMARHGRMGRYIRLSHPQSYESQYQHLDRFASGLRKGDKVKQGDLIGYVGRSGNVRRTQVCLRMWHNQKEIRPLELSLPQSNPLPETQKKAFLRFRKQLDQHMNSQPLTPSKEPLARR
ncbi:MAG: peptidoglycan DD-metalloendopeptidase family protein [Bacteroidota bacterium]